jgi:hypothetical protein
MMTAYHSSKGSVIASLNNIPSVKYLQAGHQSNVRAQTFSISEIERKRKPKHALMMMHLQYDTNPLFRK